MPEKLWILTTIAPLFVVIAFDKCVVLYFYKKKNPVAKGCLFLILTIIGYIIQCPDTELDIFTLFPLFPVIGFVVCFYRYYFVQKTNAAKRCMLFFLTIIGFLIFGVRHITWLYEFVTM